MRREKEKRKNRFLPEKIIAALGTRSATDYAVKKPGAS